MECRTQHVCDAPRRPRPCEQLEESIPDAPEDYILVASSTDLVCFLAENAKKIRVLLRISSVSASGSWMSDLSHSSQIRKTIATSSVNSKEGEGFDLERVCRATMLLQKEGDDRALCTSDQFFPHSWETHEGQPHLHGLQRLQSSISRDILLSENTLNLSTLTIDGGRSEAEDTPPQTKCEAGDTPPQTQTNHLFYSDLHLQLASKDETTKVLDARYRLYKVGRLADCSSRRSKEKKNY